MTNQPKKQFQIARLFGLAAPKAKLAGMDTHDYLAQIRGNMTRGRTESLKELTFDEANDMIKSLGGTPFSLFTRSKRTENYRKQQAGVKTIETDAQLKLIDELAALRGWSHESLAKFCQRVIKKDSPTTTDEGNKITEGLKAMNKRDGLLSFKGSSVSSPHVSKGSSLAAKEPKFRRVA